MLIDDLNKLFSNAVTPKRRRYKANTFVFRQGDPVQGIFALEAGQVKLERYTSEGRSAMMHMAQSKESFAEAALFSDVYHCYAMATRPSEVMLYPKAEVLKALQADSQTALHYVALLSAHVQTLRTHLELRSVLSARERIQQYLVLASDAKTQTVHIPGTLKDLAAQLGLAHETFYRELKNLEQEGRIERGDDWIKVTSSI